MEPPVKNAFALELEVVAEDIDALDHVSNVRVVDWMNRAALAHSAALGFDMARYREVGGVFVVKRHEIDYVSQAFLGEKLVAFTWPSAIERASAERRHEIRRRQDGKVVARGLNVWVWVDAKSQRPARIPEVVATTFDPKKFV